VNTAGDTMTGTLTLSPAAGVALYTAADVDLRGRVMRGTATFLHATGTANTGAGVDALGQIVGGSAEDVENTAVGSDALGDLTTGSANTAVGAGAMALHTGGTGNTAVGGMALEGLSAAMNTGDHNTALGQYALHRNSTGFGNIGIGFGAGQWIQTGSNNIFIGGGNGSAATSNTIRVGSAQTSFFAAGISGVGVIGSQVFVDSSGQLGVATSSRAFKDDIRDMGEVTEGLLHLRPVSFRYKQGDAAGAHPLQYGLIAEEVAEVYPELVSYSASGEPRSVQYQFLSPMLLNEVQRQRRLLEEQETAIGRQQSRIEELEARLAGLEAALGANR
jgi:hypothetical protein